MSQLSLRASLVERLPDKALGTLRNLKIGWVRRQIRRRGYVTNRLGVRMYVNQADPRALWLARNRGVTSPEVVALWRRLVDELEPAIVLDVGANYGEVTFSATYPPHTAVHLVEANPEIVGVLRRTVSEARMAGAASLHACAASDRSGTLTLHVSGGSSGLSSIIPRAEAARLVSVPAHTLDSLIESDPGSSLLFKIDVEGYELPVLRGMSRLLADHPYAGIVEAWPGSESELVALHEVYIVERGTLSLQAVGAEALGKHLRNPRPGYLRDVLVKRREETTC
jgi:FkbM family methyltransferase